MHARKIKDEMHIKWELPRSQGQHLFDCIETAVGLVSEVGLGITSSPITHLTYPALLAAIEKTIQRPWLLHPVKESDVSGKDCGGYYQRIMKLPHTGEVVTEHITINE